MCTIRQVVDIPEDRHLVIIVPEYVPVGKTEMSITFLPIPDFLFEDICNLKDSEIYSLIKCVELSQWVVALQTASIKLKERIFANMSKRAAMILQEDVEFQKQKFIRQEFQKQSVLSAVEEAQMEITNTIQRLVDVGVITTHLADTEFPLEK
ncbi:MAG: hypothetical protein LBU65_09905 [Planctomycetaceae bacterium]|jgi:flagellar motor switch protein FliG|nr:hypothetical protein [Planctomycetaceae bacterium]